jgi:hypothetical protein
MRGEVGAALAMRGARGRRAGGSWEGLSSYEPAIVCGGKVWPSESERATIQRVFEQVNGDKASPGPHARHQPRDSLLSTAS